MEDAGELKGQLSAKDAEITKLKATLKQLTVDFEYNLTLLESRDEELRRYDESSHSLRQSLTQKQEEAESLRRQLHAAQRREEEAKAAAQRDCRQQLQNLQREFEEEKASLIRTYERKLQDVDDEYADKLESLRGELERAQSQLKRLQSDHNELQQELDTTLEQARMVQSAPRPNPSADERHAVHKSPADAQLMRKLEAAEEECEWHKGRNAQLQEKVKTLMETVSTLRRESALASAGAVSADFAVSEITIENVSNADASPAVLRPLQQRLQLAEREAEVVTAKCAQLQEEYKVVKEKLWAAEEEAVALRRERGLLSLEVDAARGREALLRKDLTAKRAECRQLHRQLKEKSEDRSSRTLPPPEAELAPDSATSPNAAILSGVREELAVVRAENDELLAQLASCQRAVDALVTSRERDGARIAELEGLLAETARQHDTKGRQLQEAHSELDTTRAELRDAKRKLDAATRVSRSPEEGLSVVRMQASHVETEQLAIEQRTTARLQRQVRELTMKLESCTQEIKDMRKETDTLRGELEVQRASAKMVSGGHQATLAALAKAKKKVKQYREAASQAREESLALRGKLLEAAGDIRRLASEREQALTLSNMLHGYHPPPPPEPPPATVPMVPPPPDTWRRVEEANAKLQVIGTSRSPSAPAATRSRTASPPRRKAQTVQKSPAVLRRGKIAIRNYSYE